MSSQSTNAQQLNEAFRLHQQGRTAEAALLYERVIKADPKNCDALHFLGVLKASQGLFSEAKALIERSLRPPAKLSYLENYATILFQAEDYKQVIRLISGQADAIKNSEALQYVLAISLYKEKRLEEAIDTFDRVLSRNPRHVAALNEKGSALAELGGYTQALQCAEAALRLDPQYSPALLNQGNLLHLVNRSQEAVAAYEKAIRASPGVPEVFLGYGNALSGLGRFAEALTAYDRAIAINPRFSEAWFGRGNVFSRMRRHDEAFAAYDKAFKLKPDMAEVEGLRLQAKMRLCDWNNFEAEREHLLASIRQGIRADAFSLLNISSSTKDEMDCAALQSEHYRALPNTAPPYRHRRIRIAYVSNDFREHPVAYLLASLFEQHDRSQFHVYAFALCPEDDSAMQRRLRLAFEHFNFVHSRSAADIAEMIRECEIDVLVDLMGFTEGARPAIIIARPAPVQVTYLSYPGVSGKQGIDYLIADRTVVSEADHAIIDKAVIGLPDTYITYDTKTDIAANRASRSDEGLPEGAFVFCCFNNVYKITPEVFDVWMRVLRSVEHSVLWLTSANPTAQKNLNARAVALDIDPKRLVFAKFHADRADHLARYRFADLFLDTLPFNAHTTACDALWLGTPVLTRLGQSFCGRVAASILRALDLPELIAYSGDEYVNKAVELARCMEQLRAIRHKLHMARSSGVFDPASYARHLETAYRLIYQRHQNGLPASRLDVTV